MELNYWQSTFLLNKYDIITWPIQIPIIMHSFQHHKSVRNDDHCPICRTHTLSFHKERTQSDPLWVDEWVRRRNGDLYQTINIRLETIYDLQEYDVNHNRGVEGAANFMLLKVRIRVGRWCPDNIKYYVTFYEHKDDVDKEFVGALDGVWEKATDAPYGNTVGEYDGDFYKLYELGDEEVNITLDCDPLFKVPKW